MPAPCNFLQETLKTLECFAKINGDAIWIRDLQTNEVNRFGEEFYKAFDSNLTSLSSPEDWNKLLHPEDITRVSANLQSALEDLSIQKTEETYRVSKTDGTYAEILDKICINRDESGKATTLLGISTDITARKKQDLEREKIIVELLNTNANLKQFSYIISHDLRTPIANLIGLGNLIDERKIEDPLIRKTLENYKLATLQLNKNVNNLFELLIQDKKQDKDPNKETALDKVLKQTLDAVETKITECGAEIETDFSAGNLVCLNSSFLHSIFLNFLTNAIKYRNSERKLQIKVFTEKKDNALLLNFSDNGLGIDLKKYGDKVFGLYQKFHNHPDSNGLGLYIVATQVKDMGGKIWVTSEPGMGTTFTIQFKNNVC